MEELAEDGRLAWRGRARYPHSGWPGSADFRRWQDLKGLSLDAAIFHLKKTLVLFFLALDAVPCPGNGFEPLDLNLLVADQASSVGTVPDAFEGFVDERQNLTVVIALVEKKFLGIRVSSLVGDVLCAFFVRLATVLIGLRH